MTKPLTQAFIGLGNTSPTDAWGTLISEGHLLIGGAEAIIGGGTVVAFASGNVGGKAVGADLAFSWAQPYVQMLAFGTLAVGISHAFILPMIPYISVLWAFVGWCTFLLEALVASIIWAFAWIRFDGQDLISDHQRQGVQLIANLMLRPILSVLAFCGVYNLLGVTMNFLSLTFGKSFVSNQSGHFTGVVAALSGLGLLLYLQYTVAIRTTSIIHLLPDRVIRWVGGHGEGLNEDMHAHSTTAAVVGGIHRGSAEGKRAPKPSGDDDKKKGPKPGGGQQALPAGVSTLHQPTGKS